jgi:hypothetical protein
VKLRGDDGEWSQNQAEIKMGNDDHMRFRIRVRGGRGAFSLENLMRSADKLKKQVLEDNKLWEVAAAMADDLRRQIEALNK